MMIFRVSHLGKRCCNIGRLQFASLSILHPTSKCTSISQTSTLNKTLIRFHYDETFETKNLKSDRVKKIDTSTVIFPTVNDVISKPLKNEHVPELQGSTWVKIDTKWHQYPKIYMSLSKWYLTLFVVMTADAGYCLAPVTFDHHLFFFATMGTLLCSCAANTFNQIAEVPYDAQMDRTKNRPLVRNVISPLHATIFGISSAIAGVSCLYYGVNGLTAALGLSNIILYAAIYTPLKRRHWLNTWAGSIVGAIPPIMGWTAATGSLDPGAFILAGILYCWQFPHFFALAWRRKGDYARGSYHMLPLSHPEATKAVVLGHSLALCGLSLAAPFTGVTSWAFVAMAAPFNAWLMKESIQFYRKGNSNSASKLYKCSLYYLLAVSLGLVIDRKVISRLKKKNVGELS
uniref:protoheme IX farnesyltransferase, mitochondrial-like n=1 Tax=Styela clava TaxID=7725 RepID=UPI00193A2F41|nr:protoheme IX farnesyltransferase, mitochondrial-like [Styela clava]